MDNILSLVGRGIAWKIPIRTLRTMFLRRKAKDFALFLVATLFLILHRGHQLALMMILKT